MATFLVLEDDPEFKDLLATSLKQSEHDVVLCSTATEALAALKEHNIDIVVADVFIKSGGDYSSDGGIRLVSTLKQSQNSRIPVIAISGSFLGETGSHVSSTITTVGADAILAKPFLPKELLALSKKLLANR